MIGYLYLSIAVFSTSFGQLLLKKHNMQNNKISYYLVFSLLLLVSVPIFIYLSLIYLSFAIVFLSDALSIVLVVIVSTIFLQESLNKQKIFGIILIILGILMLKERLF